MSATFSLAWIAESLSSQLKSPTQAAGEVDFITSDSRKAGAQSLFVALKGERVDGHDYILSALRAGARGVISERPFSPEERAISGAALFEVKDSLQAYRVLGGAWRRRFNIPVLLVAGSNGKTTTKEVLSAILSGKWSSVLKTQGSENGFVGIPLTLLELRASHSAAVVEVGIDEPGAMEKHVEIVKPTHSVVTAVGPEHLEKLGTVEIAAHEECLALSLTAKNSGQSFLLKDDARIRELTHGLSASHAKTLSLLDKTADFYLDESTGKFWALQKLILTLPADLATRLPGRHNLSNVLCALAMAHSIGLDSEEMLTGLSRFQSAYGRSQIETRADGTLLYCDYYNAQPLSVQAGLQSFAKVAGTKKKWVCLADMLELGTEEERYHREIADQLRTINADQILLYGKRMEWLHDELSKLQNTAPFAGKFRHFSSHAEIASIINQEARAGDAIFIKGSRGMKMEEVHKLLQTRLT